MTIETQAQYDLEAGALLKFTDSLYLYAEAVVNHDISAAMAASSDLMNLYSEAVLR